jgi:uncharacterized membrane protein
MQIRFDSVKRIGRKIGIDGDKGTKAAVFLAVLIVSSVVVGYFIYYEFVLLKPEGYTTIYILDTQHEAVEYPQVIVANQNSTFSIYIDVENHMASSASFEVQVKTAKNLSIFPVDMQPSQVVEMGTVPSGGKPVEKTVNISQNTPGDYSVIFELWQHNSDGSLKFTQNYCVLKIQVIN